MREQVMISQHKQDLVDALKSILVVYESLKSGEQEWHHYEQVAADARAVIANEKEKGNAS
tara:strand:- start:778 stop:957 length:180 start_codon:yes stop_codon:yes gene_type:complete